MTVCRMVMQRVSSARILLDNVDTWEQIGRGALIHVCFLDGMTDELVRKVVVALLKAKVAYPEGSDPVAQTSGGCCTLTEAKWEVIVVPQACLSGKLKGKVVQYHGRVDKEQGERLYHLFCDLLRDGLEGEPGLRVVQGTYGNRQGLAMESPGPFTQVFEW
eukprot:jgi/Mesvir1/28993/Mv17763-RA.1